MNLRRTITTIGLSSVLVLGGLAACDDEDNDGDVDVDVPEVDVDVTEPDVDVTTGD